MTSYDTTPADMVRFANDLADTARTLSIAGFRQANEILTKQDASPVTLIDQNVENLVRSLVQETFPTHGFLGEEFGSVNLEADDIWVVDPIDGTRSFITGWPIWGTLVAKITRELPHIGLIDMPALNERWVGVCGGGCTFTSAAGHQDCHVSGCTSLEDATFYTTNILYFEDADRPKIETLLNRTRIPRFGGDCYGYGLLASGHIDLVVESELEPYDFLALVPVVEGAGGVITDWDGNAVTRHTGKRIIAAATPALHQEALNILQSA